MVKTRIASTSRLTMTGEVVTSDKLREGMIVNKDPFANRYFELIPKRMGFCDKGYHFGSGCYDRIAEWYVYKEVKVSNVI